MSRAEDEVKVWAGSTGCTMSLPVEKRERQLRETIAALEEQKMQIEDRLYLLWHELNLMKKGG